MQTSYIVQLGRKPLLSIAELCAVLEPSANIREKAGEFLVFELEKPLENPQKFLEQLGGTIKIGRVFHTLELSEENHLDHIAEHALEHIVNTRTHIEGRFNFGVSHYNVPPKHKNFLKILLKNLKAGLKERGISNRFVNKNFQNVHNVVVAEEKLTTEGIELTVTHGHEQVYLAETVAIQDFKAYGDRDYGKPARDTKKGMLPPKVAQIMINLAGLKTSKPSHSAKIIYDPFCGSGTLLMEAILMGYDVIGSDIDSKSIEDTNTNINWLTQNFDTDGRNFHIFEADITTVKKTDFTVMPNAIVAETYLGPALLLAPDMAKIAKISQELEILHTHMLRNLKSIFPTGTRCVLAIPAFRIKENTHTLKHFPQLLKENRISAIPAIPTDMSRHLGLELETNRPSLIYDRDDQYTLREIWILEL